MRILPVFVAPLLALSACIPAPRQAPPPTAPVPAPAPLPAPVPLAQDWRDWPRTAGDWRYVRQPGGSAATFGTAAVAPLLTMRCDPATRQITIARPGASTAPLTIRTSTSLRSLPVTLAQGVPTATLAASDPVLEAIAFSRGRFVIEQAGSTALVFPAWAEIGRVTEDCRG